jgi:hypothetical protein
MKTRTSSAVFAFGAVIAAAVGFTAIPAQASTLTTISPSPTCNGTTGAWIVTNVGNGSGQFPEQLPGTVICKYGETTAVFPNNAEESFAIGTSHAVWTAWNGSAGSTSWNEESMGGNAISGVTIQQDGWYLHISAQGDGGPTYCNDRGADGTATSSSGWSGWYEC